MIRKLKQIFNIQNECHSELVAETHKRYRNILKAFTLAEVLVVIGIIGVVSALTIPNLQQGTNSKEVVTKVTKARATIDEAYGRAIATYGDPCLWTKGQTTAAAQAAVWYNRIFENLKVDKDCGLVANTNRTCWDSTSNIGNNYYKVKLSDGTSMAMIANTGSITSGYGCGDTFAFEVNIDIDGPNKGSGNDCDDIYNLGFNASSYVYAGSRSGNLLRSSSGCAYWVLDKGNADFLKATATGANTSFRCPNGKYLNWSNNTTCN